MRKNNLLEQRKLLMAAAFVLAAVIIGCAAFLANRWVSQAGLSGSAVAAVSESAQEDTGTEESETVNYSVTPDPEAPTEPAEVHVEKALELTEKQKAVIVPESSGAEDSYFDDAIFIGDSRTEGFRMHSGIGETGASFLTKVGMSVDWVCSEDESRFLVIKNQEQPMNVISALALKQYGKVYISLGINETGWMSDEEFASYYREFLTRVKEEQPNAVIYLQGIIHVTQARSDQGVNTNRRVNELNSVIMDLASEFQVHYLDLNEVMTNENGHLFAYGAANDGVHLTKSFYELWYLYLKHHTVRES